MATKMASKALSIAKSMQSAVEVKEVTTTSSGGVNSTGTIVRITNIPQDATHNGRVGLNVKVKSIQLKGWILGQDVTLTDTSLVRCLIVRDNGYGSLQPSFADILQAGAVYGLRNGTPDKLRNWTVVSDLMLPVSSGGPNAQVIDVYKKLDTPVVFDGTAGTDSNKGGYFLMLLSNRSSDLPIVAVQCRVRYCDA